MTKGEIDLLRGKILNLTKEYSEQLISERKFSPGEDAVPVSGKVIDAETKQPLLQRIGTGETVR